MLGPVSCLATSPAKTYIPAPRVLPMPSTVRSNIDKQRFSSVLVNVLGSTIFFRLKLLNKESILLPRLARRKVKQLYCTPGKMTIVA